jgi:hypothetical protein
MDPGSKTRAGGPDCFPGIRTWGSYLIAPLQSPNAARDIALTKVEFRADVSGTKPVWIIGLRNKQQAIWLRPHQSSGKISRQIGSNVAGRQHDSASEADTGTEEVIGTTDFRNAREPRTAQ